MIKPYGFFLKEFGSHLLSHTVTSAVPSAAWVLTIVFGMGTGVTPKRIATERFCVKEVLLLKLASSLSAKNWVRTKAQLRFAKYSTPRTLIIKQQLT